MPTGNAKLIDDFKRLVMENRLSHAYLFFGESLEKFVFAQSLANFLENGVFEKPSRLLKETLIILPDEKNTIGIDSVRSLKYFLWQKPLEAKKRIAIIAKAENLTLEAQNSILKIVEEPPQEALIIFITNHEDNLLPALVSRLQKIYFPLSRQINSSPKFKQEINTKDINRIAKDVDQFFELLISSLRKDPVKNFKKLKKAMSCLTSIKQFNTNKRLQLKALLSWIKD